MNKKSFKGYVIGIFTRFIDVIARNISPQYLRVVFFRLMGVSIGKNTFVGKYVYFDNRNPKLIIIGNNVGIAMGVTILVHRRNINNYSIDKGYNDYPFIESPVIIEDNCQIGVNSIILPGVTIGKSSIIGAGSVVTKNIPQFSIAVGVPAKVIKRF